MRPEHCGTGRNLSSLHPQARAAIEGFAAFLAGRNAMVATTGEFVPLDRVGEPGIVAAPPIPGKDPS